MTVISGAKVQRASDITAVRNEKVERIFLIGFVNRSERIADRKMDRHIAIDSWLEQGPFGCTG
jgi:hypothetical protein